MSRIKGIGVQSLPGPRSRQEWCVKKATHTELSFRDASQIRNSPDFPATLASTLTVLLAGEKRIAVVAIVLYYRQTSCVRVAVLTCRLCCADRRVSAVRVQFVS
jgi:hypothetical protein